MGKSTFEGNKHVKSRILRDAMKNLKPIGIPHSIFLEICSLKLTMPPSSRRTRSGFRAEFQNRGYFKVLVQEPKTNIHDSGHQGLHIPLLQAGPGKSVDITMPIEEGERI